VVTAAGNRYLMIHLLQAVYWFDEALQSHMKAKGWRQFDRTRSMLLTNIAAGEHRASRIARNLGVSRQAISQMLREMAATGLVEVTVDPADKRARLVRFSPSFAPVGDAGKQTLEALERELERRIGAAGVRALRAALTADWGEPPEP
jgi:DNA-binding MarR family transcriptional regulator